MTYIYDSLEPGRRVRTKSDPIAAKALADAIVTSRQGPGAPQGGMYSGRLDRRRLARIGTGNLNVFTRPVAPKPSKVRVTILVDMSVSMRQPASGNVLDRRGPTLVNVASQVARDLADATEMLDWVTADMYAFTTGMTSDGYPATTMFPLWETGTPTDTVDVIGKVPMGYTEEGYALAAARDEMRESIGPDEQPLIIIISDGAPNEGGHVTSVVRDITEAGTPVVSVALIESAAQPKMYGDDNVVRYNGSSIGLGYDMARVIGRVL